MGRIALVCALFAVGCSEGPPPRADAREYPDLCFCGFDPPDLAGTEPPDPGYNACGFRRGLPSQPGVYRYGVRLELVSARISG